MNHRITGVFRPALALAAAIGFAGGTHAEDSAALNSADHLVQAVLESNPGLQAMQAAVDEARARADAAGRLDDPTVAYLAVPESIGSRIGTRHIVQFSQPIPWPGTLADRRARGDALQTAQGFKRRDFELHLMHSTRALFAEWQFVHAALEINQAQQALVSELVEAARGRYAGGRGTQQDVLQAQLELERLRQTELQWQQQRETLQAQLNALLNRSSDSPLPPPISAFDSGRPGPTDQGDHPAVASIEAELQAREYEVELAQRKRYPDFRLMTNYLGTLDPSEKRLQVGAAITLPIGFGRLRAEKDAARAARERTRNELEDRRAKLARDRTIALAAFQRADERVVLLETRVLPLSVDNFQAALGDYRSGRGSFLNVIDAHQRRLQAELDLERGRADRARAIADWRHWANAHRPVHGHGEHK